METYWCCKNNSIIDNFLNPDFNPALMLCIKENVRGGENGKTAEVTFFSKRQGRHAMITIYENDL
jgi:hypothetical protein